METQTSQADLEQRVQETIVEQTNTEMVMCGFCEKPIEKSTAYKYHPKGGYYCSFKCFCDYTDD